MLSPQKIETLTRVGPETAMGTLLRKYWHPVAPVLEVRERRVKPVRLLGEELVVYAMSDDRFGLVSRSCPHRGADLSYGWVDAGCLRCPYHGWLFNHVGHCVEQPFEETSGDPGFKGKVGLSAYPTAVLGGIVWGYLGDAPAPQMPDIEPLGWSHGFTEISLTELPCNWFQCQENGVDPVHFEWLHSNWYSAQADANSPRYSRRHARVDFIECEYGFVNIREFDGGGDSANPDENISGGVIWMWPYTLVTGRTIEWRVPMDDANTMSIVWQYSPLPSDVEFRREDPDAVSYWYSPLTAADGRLITSHLLNQDHAIWVGQGVVADRRAEHLGRSDVGIIKLRRRYLEEVERVQRGGDPPGVIRSTSHQTWDLPIRRKAAYVNGIPREALRKWLQRDEYEFHAYGYDSIQAGRPGHIRKMYEDAMCLDTRDAASGEAGRGAETHHTS